MRTLILATIALLALAPQDALRQTSTMAPGPGSERPFLTSEILFPLEHWHNHASMIVELPGGDLLTCWFHGSGERTADDVMGSGRAAQEGIDALERTVRHGRYSRLSGYERNHVPRPANRLWLLWPTILAKRMAHRAEEVEGRYRGDGAPAGP